MIQINIIFKIIENCPEQKLFVVKCCRQNSSKPIDEHKKIAISYCNLDFSSTYNFEESLRSILCNEIISNFENEPVLEENKSTEDIKSISVDDLLDKVVSIPFGFQNDLKEIEL
tara:strand:- start:1811 stop:2152 length:342 start_codon:yes stop_codon:yes gene_type:complete